MSDLSDNEDGNLWVSQCLRCGQTWNQSTTDWWNSEGPLCNDCKEVQA